MSSNKEILGLHRITKSQLKELCKKHQLYQTPYLNDQLYLHYQGFQAIENLEEYTGLKCLWLESNAISEIQGLECQKELRCLFLQNNLIRKIENLACCSQLDTLNLASNHISKIENCGVNVLPELSTLNLSRNYIRCCEGLKELENCKNLCSLDLSHNRIDDILVVKIFASMPELRVLVLQGNPVVNKVPQYRKTLILECKNLTYLDSRPVFPRDRACAEAWKRGGYEEERKEHVKWNKREQKKIRDSVNATLRLRIKKGDKEVQLITTSDEEDHEDEHEMKKLKFTQDGHKDLEIIGVDPSSKAENDRSLLNLTSIRMDQSLSTTEENSSCKSVDSSLCSLDVSFSSFGDGISIQSESLVRSASKQDSFEEQHSKFSVNRKIVEVPYTVPEESVNIEQEEQTFDENDECSINQTINEGVILPKEEVQDEIQEWREIEGDTKRTLPYEEAVQCMPVKEEEYGQNILEEKDANLLVDKYSCGKSIQIAHQGTTRDEAERDVFQKNYKSIDDEVNQIMPEVPTSNIFYEEEDNHAARGNDERVDDAETSKSVKEECDKHSVDAVHEHTQESVNYGSCEQHQSPEEENIRSDESIENETKEQQISKQNGASHIVVHERSVRNRDDAPLKVNKSTAAIELQEEDVRRAKNDDVDKSNFASSIVMKTGSAFPERPVAVINVGTSSSDSDTSSTSSFELSSASESFLIDKEISDNEEADKEDSHVHDFVAADKNDERVVSHASVSLDLKEKCTNLSEDEPFLPNHRNSIELDKFAISQSNSNVGTINQNRSIKAISDVNDVKGISDEADSGLLNSPPTASTISRIDNQDDFTPVYETRTNQQKQIDPTEVSPRNASLDLDDTMSQGTLLSEDNTLILGAHSTADDFTDETILNDEPDPGEPSIDPDDITIPENYEVNSWLKNLISGLMAEQERDSSDSSSLTESISEQSSDEDTEDSSNPILSMSLSDLKAGLDSSPERTDSEESKLKPQKKVMDSGEKEEITLQQIIDEISLENLSCLKIDDSSGRDQEVNENVGANLDKAGDNSFEKNEPETNENHNIYENTKDKEGKMMYEQKEGKIHEADDAQEVSDSKEEKWEKSCKSRNQIKAEEEKKREGQDEKKAKDEEQEEESLQSVNTHQTFAKVSDGGAESWWEKTSEAASTSSTSLKHPTTDDEFEEILDESKEEPPQLTMQPEDFPAEAANHLEKKQQANQSTLEKKHEAQNVLTDEASKETRLEFEDKIEASNKSGALETDLINPTTFHEEQHISLTTSKEALDTTSISGEGTSDSRDEFPSPTSKDAPNTTFISDEDASDSCDEFPSPDKPTPTLRENLDSFNKVIETINKRREERLKKINDFVNHPLTRENALQTHKQLDQQIDQIKQEKRERVRQLVEQVYAQREKYDDTLEVIEGRLMVVKRGTGALEEVPTPPSSSFKLCGETGAQEESMAHDTQAPSQYVSRGVSTNSVGEVRCGMGTTPKGVGSNSPSPSESEDYETPLSDNELYDDDEVEQHQSDTKIRKITYPSVAKKFYDSSATRTSGYGDEEEVELEVDFEKHFREKQAASQQRVMQLHIDAAGKEWENDTSPVGSEVGSFESPSTCPLPISSPTDPAAVKGQMGREEIMLLQQVMTRKSSKEVSVAEGTLPKKATGSAYAGEITPSVMGDSATDDVCAGGTTTTEYTCVAGPILLCKSSDASIGGTTHAVDTEVACAERIVDAMQEACTGGTTLEKTTTSLADIAEISRNTDDNE